MKSGARLKDIGNGAEITALVKRLELRGLVRRGRALSAAEVEAELNRIRNEKLRNQQKATEGTKA